MLEHALAYAFRGWPVFPCRHRSKEPLTMHGLKDATTDGATIRDWWRKWSSANVAIVLGSDSGIVALDVDPRHGGDAALSELILEHGPLPDTPHSLTGGGGHHFLFRHPGGKMKAMHLLADGLELRADGAYIVAPPSVHPTGNVYSWEVAGHFEDVVPAPLPAWLRVALREAARQEYQKPPVPEVLGEGQRNQGLTRMGGAMRRYGMCQDAIEAALLIENERRCMPPLEREEVQAIARSVSRYQPAGA
jgi:hypothetical protein